MIPSTDRSWGGLGRSWCILGSSWGGLGRSWDALEPLLGLLFGRLGAVLLVQKQIDVRGGLWRRFWIDLGPFGGRFSVDLLSFCRGFGVDLVGFFACFAIFLEVAL